MLSGQVLLVTLLLFVEILILKTLSFEFKQSNGKRNILLRRKRSNTIYQAKDGFSVSEKIAMHAGYK